MSMPERLEAIVFGKVQMVMYRDFVQRKASGLRLVGEVQNLRDGTVRVIAEGLPEDLEKLVQKMHRGSFLARVDKVVVTNQPAKGNYESFTINYGK